jgi:hypothetical protein
MADMKIPPGAPAVRTIQPVRAEAIRAAQRAFFEAATGETSEPKARPAAQPTATAADAAEPQRLARPGSRLDIKV